MVVDKQKKRTKAGKKEEKNLQLQKKNKTNKKQK